MATTYAESDLTSPACADRGARWLDGIKPNWHTCITRAVELETFNRCICGQVFRREALDHPYLTEGYLYAKEVYGDQWDALVPWYMTHPNAKHTYPSGIYLGFKGDMLVSIAWAKEIAKRRTAELRHYIEGI